MQLLEPSSDEAAAGLRAMAMVARAAGPIAPPARALLDAAQSVLLGTSEDVDRLDDIAPADLARALARPEIRRQLVQGMVVLSMSAGEPPVAQSELVDRFAAALSVDTAALRALRRLAGRDILLYKLCILRNGHMPDMVRNQYAHHGVVGVAKALLGLRGLVEDPTLAARYRRLETFADDTLGKRLWRHYHDHGFKFPGEAGGFPETGVYHDVSHVLAGYDTSPEGETLLGGFIAGYRERRPDHGFFTLLFVVSIFSAGVDVTPIGVGARTGVIGNVAPQLFDAIRRGAALGTDLSDDWDFWPWLELPLEEARHKLGIPPKKDGGGHAWDDD